MGTGEELGVTLTGLLQRRGVGIQIILEGITAIFGLLHPGAKQHCGVVPIQFILGIGRIDIFFRLVIAGNRRSTTIQEVGIFKDISINRHKITA